MSVTKEVFSNGQEYITHLHREPYGTIQYSYATLYDPRSYTEITSTGVRVDGSICPITRNGFDKVIGFKTISTDMPEDI